MAQDNRLLNWPTDLLNQAWDAVSILDGAIQAASYCNSFCVSSVLYFFIKEKISER